MNYFLLAETDFFRLINEAGDCNMETAYTAFATQVIELCNGGMDMNPFYAILFCRYWNRKHQGLHSAWKRSFHSRLLN